MKMNEKRQEARIIAFYLSKYDKIALKNLGYQNNSQAFRDIANILGVLPNYIKLSRDEFDVVHPYRKGWHKRPMSPSVKKVVLSLGSLDEYSLRSIIIDILKKENSDSENYIKRIVSLISSEEEANYPDYISRGITGGKAEELFMSWYESNRDFFLKNAELKDIRTYGCGYDFEISDGKTKLAIEIKGISDEYGGILFTQKEWEIAEKLRDNFFLIIISYIKHEEYQIKVIKNPFESFKPKRNIQEVIQISWTIPGKDIKMIPSL